MTTRRDPPQPTLPKPTPQESTALMERPLFSDGELDNLDDESLDGGLSLSALEADLDALDRKVDGKLDGKPGIGTGGRAGEIDVFGDAALVTAGVGVDSDELTDPNQRAVRLAAAEAPTGRFDLREIDDIDGLPSAHVSELELDYSDLDGDVAEGGAPTAIMRLPPEMLADHARNQTEVAAASSSSDEAIVDLRKWSAGPPGARHDVAQAGSPPPMAEPPMTPTPLPLPPIDTAPSLRAAAEGLHTPAHRPPPGAVPLPPAASLRAEDVSRAAPPGALRALVDDALDAVTQAQTAAVHNDEDELHRHLARAVASLARLIDHVD